MADVIHMASRRPFDQVIEEEAREDLAAIAAEDQALEDYRNKLIDLLDRLRFLVGQGRLTGLVILGTDPMTDLFLTEVHLDSPEIERQDLFAYMGVLEMLKIEMSEGASMAPVITSTGNILDPWEQEQAEFQFEDDE